MSGITPGTGFNRLAKAVRDPALCKSLSQKLAQILRGRPFRFMEVCGTHTIAIFQTGLRSILPAEITHLSGPGCPVCVTHESEVALFLDLARREDIVIATFGDLLRIPGPDGHSLKHAQAAGADARVVYSPLDCLDLARSAPRKKVVFLAAGFETTAPAVAATVLSAQKEGIDNFLVLSLHKLVPPALRALLSESDNGIDAFLLPGHVATITGLPPFAFLSCEFGKASIVAGFEPADLLLALCGLAEMFVAGRAEIGNAYSRAVTANGNPHARQMLDMVFEPCDAQWRGLGLIPKSGLALRPGFEKFDAMKQLGLRYPHVRPSRGCQCGEVLKGRASPVDCPMFGKKCTPASPLGPCMVSTEGSCAAFFKYGEF